MMRALVGALGGFLVMGAVGCGGTSDGDGGGCGSAPVCGGDLAGSWKITSSCLEMEPTMGVIDGCPGATAEAKDLTMSGTVAYGSDGTYQTSATLTGRLVMRLPASCLTQNGITVTCSQLQQVLSENAADSGYESVNCTGSGDCSCTMTLRPESSVVTGTYATSGSTVTQTADGGAPDDSSYCVKGNTLTLSPGDSDSAVTGSITLTKQ